MQSRTSRMAFIRYFVKSGGYEAEVIIAERLGHKYLKTENDGEQPDNLLALPGCP